MRMPAASAPSAAVSPTVRPVDVCGRLAYIMGTSACIMATTVEPCFVPGVWGPYLSGMVPGFWLNEGGQSAAGAAIDHLIRSHPAYAEAEAAARAAGVELLEFLEKRIVVAERQALPRRHGWRATFMYCPSFSATVRRMPTRILAL